MLVPNMYIVELNISQSEFVDSSMVIYKTLTMSCHYVSYGRLTKYGCRIFVEMLEVTYDVKVPPFNISRNLGQLLVKQWTCPFKSVKHSRGL